MLEVGADRCSFVPSASCGDLIFFAGVRESDGVQSLGGVEGVGLDGVVSWFPVDEGSCRDGVMVSSDRL